MYIKQEPEVFDVDSAPSPIPSPIFSPISSPTFSPISICQVSYDSIYDDPMDFYWCQKCISIGWLKKTIYKIMSFSFNLTDFFLETILAKLIFFIYWKNFSKNFANSFLRLFSNNILTLLAANNLPK